MVLENTQRLWSMGGPCVPSQKRTTWLPHRRREGGYATLCHQRCSRKVHEAQFILCPQKSEQISFLKIVWEKEGHMIFGV